ncbi:MAG: hypothetical protein RR744_00535 [Cellulosilyticaceae bacterium]
MAMMDESMGTGAGGLWGIVIFFILLFFIFDRKGLGADGATVIADNGCSKVSNCEVEKQTIINTATTQFLIEQKANQQTLLALEQANKTNMTVIEDGNKTREKIDFYAYEGLKDQLAQSRAENIALRGQVYSDSKFNALEMQLAGISCNMPTRPPFYSAGGLPCATKYPTGCGSGATTSPSFV